MMNGSSESDEEESSESDEEDFSESKPDLTESPDDITFSSLTASQLIPTSSNMPELDAGVVSAPNLALSAPATGFNDDFAAAQSERQYVQEKAQGFLDAAVQAAIMVDGTLETAYAQSELIECALHDDIAGVNDYSTFFRDNFQLDNSTHPRCFNLLRHSGSGERDTVGSDAG
jgi:hypothetical protein